MSRQHHVAEEMIGKLRNELLNDEIFDTILETSAITEQWRKQCDTVRSHCSLAYRPPAQEV
jgi:hypothetical protein